MLKLLHEVPVPARWLGFSGLIPFVAAAVAGLVGGPPLHDLSLRALLAYGAVILSFLGGVRWGLTIATPTPDSLFKELTISVLPSLLGWASLLLPLVCGLWALAIGITAMLVVDIQLPQAPLWYRLLRIPLSVGAISALIVSLTV